MQVGNNYSQFMPNNGFPQGTGFQYNGYNQNQQQPRRGNFLNQAQVEKLMKKSNQFSLSLTEEDNWKAMCNHRKPDGTGDMLVENPDGSYTCQICGYTFRPLDAHNISPEEIQADVDNVVDVLQTIKMIYIDLDPGVAKEYFNIIPLLEKMPQFLDIAIKNYAKHEQYNPYSYGKTNLGTAQMFAALSGLFNGNGTQGYNQYNQQQPYQGQQFYGQQPYQGYAQQQPYGANPFGYNGATQQQPQGYQPQTGGFAYNPLGFNNPSQYTAPGTNPQQQATTTAPQQDTTAASNIKVSGGTTAQPQQSTNK